MVNKFIFISIQRLNRFLNNKNESDIIFNDIIDIKRYCDNNLNSFNIKYDLITTINHSGNINECHYFSIIKIKDNWYEFNDNKVIKLNEMIYISNSVCLFIYEKI